MNDLIASGAVSSESITASAKFGQDVVQATVAFGGWVAKVLGDVPSDLVGLVGGDILHHVRLRNLAKLEAKTECLMANVAEHRKTEASPSIVMPIIETASNESRDELLSLWASLLANSRIDGGRKVRTTYVDAVRKLDAQDAVLLTVFREGEAIVKAHGMHANFNLSVLAAGKGLDRRDMDISIDVLIQLGLVRHNAGANPHVLTPFGSGLVAAVTVE